MGRLLDLGTRIELVSMDRHFHDISIGLYEHAGGGAPAWLVHSYSARDGVPARLAFVTRAMAVLGGMVPAPAEPARLAFACGEAHRAAVKRLFLEVCKLEPDAVPAPRPMRIEDRKNDLTIEAAHVGGGLYRLKADGGTDADRVARRVDGVVRGLARLAELETEGGAAARFPCGSAHDELVGLLLPRALNVRAAMREAEAAAARGVLAAPSAQAQT